MSFTRPTHLDTRQISIVFDDEAVLITTAVGTRNEHGEWVPGTRTETPIECATAPGDASNRNLSAEERQLLDEGARLSDKRTFFLDTQHAVKAVAESAGSDYIRYKNVEYRVVAVEDWDVLIVVHTINKLIAITAA